MMKKQFHKVVSKFTLVFLIIGMLVGGCKEKETSKVAVRLPSFPAIKSSIQKIACVGDSITYGSTLQDRKSESYPSQLSKRFGNTIQVKNFGVDGAAVQKTAILSYWNCKEMSESLSYQSDVIFLMLGTNDSKSVNWQNVEAFKKDYISLIETYQQALPKAVIYLMLPSTMYSIREDGTLIHQFSQSNMKEIQSVIKSIAKEKQLPLIDIHSVTADHEEYYRYDGIHPNADGAAFIAQTVYDRLVIDQLEAFLRTFVNWEIKAMKILIEAK